MRKKFEGFLMLNFSNEHVKYVVEKELLENGLLIDENEYVYLFNNQVKLFYFYINNEVESLRFPSFTTKDIDIYYIFSSDEEFFYNPRYYEMTGLENLQFIGEKIQKKFSNFRAFLDYMYCNEIGIEKE